MSDSESKKAQSAKRRRPYERPQVTSETVFETLALSCSKDNPNTGCLEPTLSS